MDINQVITSLSQEEATKQKNVLAGTSEFIETNLVTYDPNSGFEIVKSVRYIPSLFTVVNEIITNASDHFINCINKSTIQHQTGESSSRLVTYINISMTSTGVISVENDGYGIPIQKNDKGIYVPIALFTDHLYGTNMKENPYRILGGTNGLGAKIVTTFSSSTTIECQDKHHCFKVIITNNGKKKVVGEPTITPNQTGKQFTKVTFKIDWQNTNYKQFNKKVSDLFTDWIYTRCALLSIFLNQYSPCKLTFCNQQFPTKYSQIPKDEIFSMTLPVEIKDTKLLGSNNSLFGTCVVYLSIIKSGKPIQLSIINGIEVTSNPILTKILNQLYKNIKSDVYNNAKAELTKAIFEKHIVAIFVGTIMNPQYVGQTKNGITITSDWFKNYTINYTEVSKTLSTIYSEQLIVQQSRKTIKSKQIDNKKYIPANNVFSGKKKRNTVNYLWLAEGDSALSLIRKGLGVGKKNKNVLYNFDNSGMLSLGGVIINTHNRIKLQETKNFKYIKDKSTDTILLMDKKCTENIFIDTFIKAMGLRMDCSYSTEAELNTLNYSYVIIATDQDKDGWNINGLLLVFLNHWPNLIKYGRVQRLQTPIARVKPTKLTKANISKTIEFFTEKELESYLEHNKVPKSMETKYYKGLGTTEDEYCLQIFSNIGNYIFTFRTSEKSVKLLDAYYNKLTPDERKKELSTPLRELFKIEENYYKQKILNISTFLQIYVKDYQLDNLNRKLPKIMDGQNNVCGKILASCSAIYSKNTSVKVSYLGNEVAKKTNYHHGEMSMYETIFKNTQTFPGKKMYPMLTGLGQMGDRINGGKVHAAPRYTFIEQNKKIFNAFFKSEDEILFEYVKSDDQFVEPKYLYPVLPLVLLENYKTTAHGWKIEIWGRSLTSVISALNDLINNRTPTDELNINEKLTNADLVTTVDENGMEEIYSKGKYRIERNTKYDLLIISELPLGIWNDKYIADIESNEFLKENCLHKDLKIKDNSVENEVDIMIPLVKGWEEKLIKREDSIFNDIELSFKLRVKLQNELNFISENGSVVSFKRYVDALIYWFNIRKNAYILRINRRREILKNLILFNESIHKYLKNFHTWNLGKRLKRDEAHQIISSNGLIMLNPRMVEPTAFIPTNKICEYVKVQECTNTEYDLYVQQGFAFGYASYEYLDSIRNDKVRDENIKPIEEKIVKYKAELEYLMRPNIWKHLWVNELKCAVDTLQVIQTPQ